MTRIGKTAGALCLLLVFFSATSWGAITAGLDRDRAALGDTLRLTIIATDGEDLGDIDLQPLSDEFEILQRSNSSKTSYVNGTFTSTSELALDITPRRQGNLAIPPLRLGQKVTNGIPVVVGPPPKNSAPDQNLVFEAELDRSSVYVQGQLILTLRLQQAINLEDRNITQLQLDDAFVRPLEQNSFQRNINGRPWLVHEIRYAIFPEQSGTLTIPVQTFTARERTQRRSLFDLGGGGRQVRRMSEPLTIEVLPRPASFPASEWLPASDLALEESWSTPPGQLKVGESATRTITIRSEGLQGAQLPPVLFTPVQGLKYYPDQPVISDGESAQGLAGMRVDSAAVVPTKAGTWQIPELRIPWWDTSTNELRYAVLPGRELQVGAGELTATTPTLLPAPTQTLSADAATDIPVVGPDQGYLWQVIAAVNGAGWLLTFIYLLRSRRGQKKPAGTDRGNSGEKAAFKDLLAACKQGDPQLARQALVQWSAVLTSQPGLTSIGQTASALRDPALNTALTSLNSALYSATPTSWNGADLAEAARQLRSQRQGRSKPESQQLHLYPQTS